LTGKAEAPYRAFLFQGLTQDAKGRKMSKSVGNVIEANKLLEKSSADVCRFYLLRKCSPIEFMDFDVQDLRRRPYQVLSTLYHLNRFFVQNAEYDNFDPQKHTVEWAKQKKQLKKTDLWLLSKLQEAIEKYTVGLQKCEFNLALATLEDFVIDTLSRLYVPMIRKELWTDDPETLDRRLTIYANLWHTLKTVTLLFNPITPYLSESLYQKAYKRLDQTLPESVNFENWPTPSKEMRDEPLEEDFENLFRCVSLVYSARQSAKLKRRWPLRKVVVASPKKISKSLTDLEEIFLELANVKRVEYTRKVSEYVSSKEWVSASEGETQVFLNTSRDSDLLGEGLMRDLARRVQSLRKELGYVPTDVLNAVHIAKLEERSVNLLKPYLKKMEEVVRAEKVYLHESREVDAEWHEYQLDNKKVYIAIS
ncbi:class I tRNA ligase family protein, partial [Candidatus Bathyarchaeota archaeon]|nr:class I tRNA ligase family protein [Candidatus Bathyarchaeota archaeon]